MTSPSSASLNGFEQALKTNNITEAFNQFIKVLTTLDQTFGAIQGIEFTMPSQLNVPELSEEQTIYFCTKAANLITELFSRPDLTLTYAQGIDVLIRQRWLALIFATSPYVNADHILNQYLTQTEDGQLHIPNDLNTWIKFCIMYLPESTVNINLDAIWNGSNYLCAALCFALQSPRFIGTPVAFGKRHNILKWFPEKLAQLDDLTALPSAISHDVYMHCSYDIDANKHLVKKSLNGIIRKHVLKQGWQDRDVSVIGETNGKPVMVVLLEHFHAAHSIYRTHSTSIEAARDKFHIIGIGQEAVDQAGRDVFHEFHLLKANNVMEQLAFVRNICEQHKAAVLYMPSIGMFLETIFASNTRLAPIQAIALGHPATTHSDFIEHVIVEDDYVGSEDCFSEELIRLPKDALPYKPSALAPNKVEYRLIEKPEVVHIGVASTTMKLNPYFLEACKVIRNRAKVKVHFHFALGQSIGVTHPYVKRFIKSYLGEDATVYQHLPYDQYLRRLYQCDMMINPFPFGNTNGIIDMVTLGLIGICKTGPEVHEHIDEGLFKRLGLPEWLIANTADEYVERAIRLAENHEERISLRRHIIENNGLHKLFTGDATPLGIELLKRVKALNLPVVKQDGSVVAAETATAQTPAAETKDAPKKADKTAKKTASKTVAKKGTKKAKADDSQTSLEV